MPLQKKYVKIKSEMIKKYGKEKGTKIFHAWINKENIKPEVKSYYFITEQLKAIGEDIVEGYFATGDPDAYNDILTEECLTDMVEQMNSLPITIDDDHESFKSVPEEEKFRSLNPIAKVTSAVLKGARIKVKTVLNNAHSKYQEYKSSIKNGFLHSFSFAFIPIETKSIDIDGVKHRVVNKVRVLNGCFTGIPVNAEATFSNVMLKSLTEFDYDEVEVNDIIRGVNMSDNKEVEETPKVEEEPKVEEKPEVVEDSAEEVKSLIKKVDALEKSVSELKSLSEEKEEDKKEDEEVKEEKKSKVDVLEKEIAELKALIEKPQMKARVEKELNEEDEGTEEKKSMGPLDAIK